MKRNTRQEIMDTAKRLFNERGFNAVSTKDISESLGISKGNLTYHFKKKEDIIEAIIEENSNYQQLKTPKNLDEMNYFFLNIQQVVKDNAFYFWHHTQMAQLSSNIHNKQNNVYYSNVKKLTKAFQTLNSDGLLRNENFSGEYNCIIDTLLISSIYWIPFSNLKQNYNSQINYQYHAWAILSNLLTHKGKYLLRHIISL